MHTRSRQSAPVRIQSETGSPFIAPTGDPGLARAPGTVGGGAHLAPRPATILSPDGRAVSRAGAVSGAAQTMASRFRGLDRGVALSDGSRITFASVTDLELLRGVASLLHSDG